MLLRGIRDHLLVEMGQIWEVGTGTGTGTGIDESWLGETVVVAFSRRTDSS